MRHHVNATPAGPRRELDVCPACGFCLFVRSRLKKMSLPMNDRPLRMLCREENRMRMFCFEIAKLIVL